jgi:UDP-N-acetylglucosamine 2-epimerase (non-hydrolysing)
MWISVVHLEAGLRSRDRRMPEEINRLATDAISDVLWTPSPDADENLLREGVPAERIDRVGNIMIDSYEMMRPQIEEDDTPRRMGLERGKYIVVTLHRPSNVDRRETLTPLVEQLLAAAARLPVVFALLEHLRASRSIHLTEPLGYVQFMALVSGAAAAVTDSGGVQEESTYLGIPCLTLRENTERPITVTQGSNRLVQPLELLENVERVLAGQWPAGSRPEGWDGKAAQRCVAALWAREQRRRKSG